MLQSHADSASFETGRLNIGDSDFWSSIRSALVHGVYTAAHQSIPITAMAAQSKIPIPSTITTAALTESNIKRIIGDLTNLYLKHRSHISRAIYITLFVALINRIRNAIAEQKAAAARQAEARQRGAGATRQESTSKRKVELNREFFKNLLRLLRIVMPGWKSKELRSLIGHSFFLVLRTLISLYVAELDGKLVSNLVRGKGKEFLTGLVWWMIVAIPATFTNSMVLHAALTMDDEMLTTTAVDIPSMQTRTTIPHTPHQLHT